MTRKCRCVCSLYSTEMPVHHRSSRVRILQPQRRSMLLTMCHLSSFKLSPTHTLSYKPYWAPCVSDHKHNRVAESVIVTEQCWRVGQFTYINNRHDAVVTHEQYKKKTRTKLYGSNLFGSGSWCQKIQTGSTIMLLFQEYVHAQSNVSVLGNHLIRPWTGFYNKRKEDILRIIRRIIFRWSLLYMS